MDWKEKSRKEKDEVKDAMDKNRFEIEVDYKSVKNKVDTLHRDMLDIGAIEIPNEDHLDLGISAPNRKAYLKYEEKQDKNGNSYLQVKYYDVDSEYLAENHYLNNITSRKKFNINFLRSHMKQPELNANIEHPWQVINIQNFLRSPSFVIARKQGKFWKITEKIFAEEL